MQILKAAFQQEDIRTLKERGLAHDCNLRGTSFDEPWNAIYNGMVDIRAWFPKDKVPTWMHVRVDTEDGVPWLVNVVFKIPEGLRVVVEEKAKELAKRFDLSESKVSINAYHATSSQNFGSFGHVLQINSINEDPEKLLSFLQELEKILQAAPTEEAVRNCNTG